MKNTEMVIIKRRRYLKYENALISIACLEYGDDSGLLDEPGSAQEAREALGKRMCNKIKRSIGKGW